MVLIFSVKNTNKKSKKTLLIILQNNLFTNEDNTE